MINARWPWTSLLATIRVSNPELELLLHVSSAHGVKGNFAVVVQYHLALSFKAMLMSKHGSQDLVPLTSQLRMAALRNVRAVYHWAAAALILIDNWQYFLWRPIGGIESV